MNRHRCTRFAYRAISAALALLLLGSASEAACGQSAPSPEMVTDRAHQDRTIRWPAEFDPKVAPVFSHNELLIHANCQHTFQRFIDAKDWPNWVGFLKDVSFESPSPLRNNTLLKLTIFGSPIQSRVVEFVPNERVSWIPYGSDETETRHGHYHAWHFIPAGAGCRVLTEETGIGPGDTKDPVKGSHLMHQAHELWLDGLRYTSEP